MATIEVKWWSVDDFRGTRAEVSRRRECAEGGTTGSGACRHVAEFTIIYPDGNPIATCPDHLITYVRTRLGDDAG